MVLPTLLLLGGRSPLHGSVKERAEKEEEKKRGEKRRKIKNEQDRWSEGWRERIMRRRRRRVQRDSGNYPSMTAQAAVGQSNRETKENKQTNKLDQK